MTHRAADLLRDLLHEQATRARVPSEASDRKWERLRALCLDAWRHGLGATEVAKASGVSRQSLYKWIDGSNAVSW